MNDSLSILSPAASAFAHRTDTLFLTLAGLALFILLVLAATAVFFCIKYRAGSRASRAGVPLDAPRLEWTWTIAILLAFLALFAWSAHDYSGMTKASADAEPIYVVARQWVWTVQHAGGRREIDELHVPAGRPVRLLMTSQDAVHSLYLPALRVKQDVLPGRYTTLNFRADVPGRYPLLCAEYCGTEHASMAGGLIVMPPEDYARWQAGAAIEDGLRRQGLALFREHGCVGCHGRGSTVRAPSLDGLFGRRVALQDGSAVVADENYLRDSILVPAKQVAAGYAPVMPSYAGQLSEQELTALAEYLRNPGATPPSESQHP
ncbi:Cytochrome c oxidase subunit 2 precursor [Pigmentiphaga humi]|uniref:Cytochrome c oxidase subunit 2 n=1 Tax=Pigmentiphaga humi TaxID=2478468 RepID=A0A3P4AZK4_9BURK|nr:c-type cytochrome [Pigmentiphaga humi]VCU68796.1 Cytochrome c oxidase subunit 2 precursor [Pigmentiphaga humi]